MTFIDGASETVSGVETREDDFLVRLNTERAAPSTEEVGDFLRRLETPIVFCRFS